MVKENLSKSKASVCAPTPHRKNSFSLSILSLKEKDGKKKRLTKSD
jgi:hypothetical protein